MDTLETVEGRDGMAPPAPLQTHRTIRRDDMSYTNRIIELKHLPCEELQDNTGNWRRHPQAQRDALRGVLEEIGVAGALTAYYSERHGGRLTLIDGHLRREVMGGEVPVLILNLNDHEADKLLTVFDPLGAMAEADNEKLKALLESVVTESEGLENLLEELGNTLRQEEFNPKQEAEPPPYFKEYDEEIPTEYHCPKCGYQWSGKPK
jgi:hypothetical protein